ncbi:MAG TPA: DUF2461 domain-containing protein [Alphaproteobacteria bacterium]|nr:DUF2461 domain-containing protein [Alphaproteobacteria bacterium]
MSARCFPQETRSFLAGIAEHNDKAWFAANRTLYEAGYVDAGRAFVAAIGPELRAISPTVQYEARIGGSVMRVNRDTRFSRDKRTYKDHLDLLFWHGERKGWTQPGFFVRLTASDVWLGSGMHHLEGDLLTRYRNAVMDERSGEALVAAIAAVEAAGDYAIGSMPRKSVPRGYDRTSPRARYLLWEGLPAMTRMSMDDALAPGFGDLVLEHFRHTWPIGRWLMDEVTGAPQSSG